jgi:hypothetical protein
MLRSPVSLDVLLLQVALAFGLSVWVVCSRTETPTAPGSPIKGLGAAGHHRRADIAGVDGVDTNFVGRELQRRRL